MTDEQAELDYTTTPPKLTQKGELEAAANRYRNGLYGGIVLPGTGMDRDAELLAREYCRIEPNVELHQAQIDRLQSQILTLRLIADRAVVFLVAGSNPDQSQMTMEQLGALNTYMDAVDYNDLAEAESTEQGFIDLIVRPLNEIMESQDGKDSAGLLKMAMQHAEQQKLIQEEMKQLKELNKLRPDLFRECDAAFFGLMFATQAAVADAKDLRNLYSPTVTLSRRVRE